MKTLLELVLDPKIGECGSLNTPNKIGLKADFKINAMDEKLILLDVIKSNLYWPETIKVLVFRLDRSHILVNEIS